MDATYVTDSQQNNIEQTGGFELKPNCLPSASIRAIQSINAGTYNDMNRSMYFRAETVEVENSIAESNNQNRNQKSMTSLIIALTSISCFFLIGTILSWVIINIQGNISPVNLRT